LGAPTKRPKLDRSARTHYRGGHYSNAGWLSSGMRFEYRPCTATSGPKNHPQIIEVLLTELGQLGFGLVGAPRERTRLRNRGEVAIGWRRCLGFWRQGRLRGHGVFAAIGKNLFDLGVRAGDDVYRH
jgi:hypothetical protein